jgi:hypothetical protein
MNRPTLAATGFVFAVTLSACQAPPSGGQAEADAQTRAACEQRAEQVYEQQNRAEIYSPAAPVNTPYSANYVPDASSRGLSDLFAHDRMINDCVRNTGTGAERDETDTAAPPPVR